MRRILWLALLAVGCASATSVLESFQRARSRRACGRAAVKATTTKVWIGRYAEYEEFLRTAEIVRDRDDRILGTIWRIKRAYFKPGGPPAGAALRSIRPQV